MKKNKGITLLSLVITIMILIILAAVVINMTIGENGIFTKAQETKKAQAIAEAKEKIGTEILAAQVEAIERNEELEQSQVEDIISKYGELQADGDTIILNVHGYEVSLKEIYSGTTTTGGSYSELKAKVALLEQQLEDATKSQTQSSKELSDLKTTLAQTTVTQAQILKDYTAYIDGELKLGTMENYAGETVAASSTTSDDSNMYLSIPNAGYYDTNSKISTSRSNLTKGIVVSNGTNMSTYTDRWREITTADFKFGCTGQSTSVVGNWDKTQPEQPSGSVSSSITGSYNSSTGIISISANSSTYYLKHLWGGQSADANGGTVKTNLNGAFAVWLGTFNGK